MGDPMALWRATAKLWWASAETAAQAWATIALRGAMVGRSVARGRLPASELTRMVAEKQAAALASAAAAVEPYRRATRANARRLARKRR
jgi:hypothetical protein